MDISNKHFVILVAVLILILIACVGLERVRECREKGGSKCDLSPVLWPGSV